MRLNNISRYYPDVMPDGDGVQYFVSENGKDFHKFMRYFKKKYKLLINENAVVLSCAEDVSTLYPVGFSVVEINELPDDFDTLGGWMFNKKGEVVPYAPWYQSIVEKERTTRTNDAMTDALLLTGKVTLNLASDDEKRLFAALSDYINQLKALDFSGVIDAETRAAFVWPEKPQ